MRKSENYSDEEIKSGNLILESFMDESFYILPEDRDKYCYLKHLCEIPSYDPISDEFLVDY